MRLNVELSLRKAANLATKQPAEAASILAEVLTKFPNNTRAQALMADMDKRGKALVGQGVLQQLHRLVDTGQSAEALAFAGTLPPAAHGSADLQIGLGRALYGVGRHQEAASRLRLATQIRPDQLACWIAAGNAAFLSEDWSTAEACFNAAHAIAPSNEDVLNNLGMTLAAQRKFNSAEVIFAKAAATDPQNATIAYNRANAFRDAGLHDQAVAFYTEALRLKPDYASAANNLGTVLHQLGRNVEAEAAYLQAVKVRPDYAQAHRNLSAVHKYSADDPLLPILDERLAAALPDRDRMYLSFARSKAHEDNAEYEEAFDFLVRANAIRKRLLGYDFAVDELLFATIRRLFAQPLAQIDETVSKPRPVFVLGMMRSGTTLVEQIVSSHSDVFGAGELETLGKLCLPLMERYHATGQGPDLAELKALRDVYLMEIDGLSAGTYGVVTDKMPVNFRWIGFILAALPEACVIHMRRDPIATCWSIFKHYFSSDGNGYAFDLGDVAAYWHLYDDLMAHWHKIFPGRILDVPYESLTEEPELWSRRIVEFAGLDWQEACLAFHLNPRAVRTASASQVKQRMYRGSSEAWRKYGAQLAPLVAALSRRP